MKKNMLRILAILALAGSTAPATAADSAPSYDAEKCPIEYPHVLLRAGEEGRTTVLLHIGPDGSVLHSKLETSSGNTRMDREALKKRASCRFVPAIKDGAPAEGWIRVNYDWTIRHM